MGTSFASWRRPGSGRARAARVQDPIRLAEIAVTSRWQYPVKLDAPPQPRRTRSGASGTARTRTAASNSPIGRILSNRTQRAKAGHDLDTGLSELALDQLDAAHAKVTPAECQETEREPLAGARVDAIGSAPATRLLEEAGGQVQGDSGTGPVGR